MKRLASVPTILALLLFLLGLRIGLAQDAPALTYLAHIANGAAQVSNEPVLLDSGDNSFVDSVVSSDGQCTFLSYIDRDNGNRLWIRQDAGDRLIDVPLPPSARKALDGFARQRPNFTAPGEKQADGSMSIRNGVLSIHFTGRAEGDEAGKFFLWRLDIVEPACQL